MKRENRMKKASGTLILIEILDFVDMENDF